MPLDTPTPWSKKHKAVTKAAAGGLSYSLSNSFAEPLTTKELIKLTHDRGDQTLVDEYLDHSLRYTANGGSLDLRTAISDLYSSAITPAHILVFPGAQIALKTAAVVLAGDVASHAIVFTPGYQSVQEGPGHAGGQVTKIELSARDGWQIDLGEVEKAINENTRYIVCNEPYNPGGTLMSAATQRGLVSLASKRGIHILCDEVYRLLEHDPADRLPAMAEAYGKGLSVVTLSKPWGGCGVSIGWCACQDLEVLERMTDVQYFDCACMGRASELLAIMTLRASEVILAKNLGIIRENLVLLQRFVEGTYRDLFEWVKPCAGAIAFIKFKGPMTSNELGAQLALVGISIKPSYCFTDEVTTANDYFRVGFGEIVFKDALEKLGEFVEERKEEWRAEMMREEREEREQEEREQEEREKECEAMYQRGERMERGQGI